MGGTGVIDNFLGVFTQYIDSGFGLVQGDVRWLAGVLIGIDITLAGLLWAMAPDEEVLARLIKKTLYIGVFAFIIGNYNNLAKIIYNSFAGLGIEASGGTMSQAQLLQPGRVAQVGVTAGQPILTAISGLMGFASFFDNFVQIAILLLAWVILVISFFIMAIQLFVSLIEFKLTTLAGFVLVPFGLFGRTAFLAEKVLGNVVSSGVKILVLAVIVGIGSTIFGQFTSVLNNPPTITDALTLILAALSMLGLTIFGPGIANGLIAGGPQLGAGAAVGTGMAVAGVGFAGASLAAGGIGAAGSAIAGAARTSASVVGAAATAFRGAGATARVEADAAPPASPLRSGGPSGSAGPTTGGQAAAGQASAPGSNAPSEPESSGPPAWVRRMKRDQAISRGVSAVEHALRSGDHPSSGGGVDLSEGD
jgi:type IV secretion system protein TrbL